MTIDELRSAAGAAIEQSGRDPDASVVLKLEVPPRWRPARRRRLCGPGSPLGWIAGLSRDGMLIVHFNAWAILAYIEAQTEEVAS